MGCLDGGKAAAAMRILRFGTDWRGGERGVGRRLRGVGRVSDTAIQRETPSSGELAVA